MDPRFVWILISLALVGCESTQPVTGIVLDEEFKQRVRASDEFWDAFGGKRDEYGNKTSLILCGQTSSVHNAKEACDKVYEEIEAFYESVWKRENRKDWYFFAAPADRPYGRPLTQQGFLSLWLRENLNHETDSEPDLVTHITKGPALSFSDFPSAEIQRQKIESVDACGDAYAWNSVRDSIIDSTNSRRFSTEIRMSPCWVDNGFHDLFVDRLVKLGYHARHIQDQNCLADGLPYRWVYIPCSPKLEIHWTVDAPTWRAPVRGTGSYGYYPPRRRGDKRRDGGRGGFDKCVCLL
jgi:hypothetical protein